MQNRLRQLRKEKGLTLREMANQINMSFSNIATLERGETQLREDTTKLFADFFNVSSDYLLGLTDKRIEDVAIPPNPDIEDAFYNQKGIVTEEQKKEVENFINFIKSKEQSNE